jgi:hypothetical protein
MSYRRNIAARQNQTLAKTNYAKAKVEPKGMAKFPTAYNAIVERLLKIKIAAD